ncbi:MAG: Hint domain-containing protein [Pseudomonadota bacterium]
MAWIGLTDRKEGRFAPFGLGAARSVTPILDDGPGALLTRGTLVVEAQLLPDGRPQDLFGFEASHPWPRRLVIQVLPNGSISLVHQQADRVCHAVLRWPATERAETIRISYAWDAPKGMGQLALEQPETGGVETVNISAPMPLMIQDVHAMMLGHSGRITARDVAFAAVSTQVEPVGPQPSLTADVPVATPYGYRAAGTLQRGDTVLTEQAGVVPVLHRVDRTVPARGAFQPLRLFAPYFGLVQDIVVAPSQRLVIRGSEVEYLFGREAVLVPARHLLNGHVGRVEPSGSLVRYTQLVLPGHETVMTAGTWSESLYLGRIRRHAPRVAQSVLAGCARSLLPEHAKPAFPVLRRFEAVTLADQRAA